MEDSFRVRVDKVFGSLSSHSASSAGVTPSLWCLTDEEVETQDWNRNKEDEERDGGLGLGGESGPSTVRNLLEDDLRNLGDDGEEEEGGEEIDGESRKRRRNNTGSSAEISVDDDFDVRSNIGRDCTLDYEEEEDEYDKVAVGTKWRGDRVYMRDVKSADYGIDELNEYAKLPNVHLKDPRANHEAAKNRLKEDAEAAGNFDTLQLSDNSGVTTNTETGDLNKGEFYGDNPKPILKKREKKLESRSEKRVRFSVDPKGSTQSHEGQESSGASDLASEPRASDENAVPEQASSDLSQYSSGVPDYIRNPSKYTHYTFNSSDDMDDQSNQKAYMDLFSYLRKGKTHESVEDASVELPKSVVFTPKRKPEEDSRAKRREDEHKREDNLNNRNWSIGITAEEAQESEVSAMEEDEPSLAVDKERSLHKPGRRYRTRTNDNVDDNLN